MLGSHNANLARDDDEDDNDVSLSLCLLYQLVLCGAILECKTQPLQRVELMMAPAVDLEEVPLSGRV